MPITISICDDDSEQISYIRSCIAKWSNNKSFVIQINEYESAEQFIFQYEDNPCDLLLLDIEMGRINGMELAKQLRSRGDMLPIAFITGFYEYAAEGYDVEALHYLLKPLAEDKLFHVLDRFAEKHMTKASEILVRTADGSTHISVDKITFIEAFGRSCQMNRCCGEAILCEMGIGEFKDMKLADFVACHRSYFVNLRHIKSIGKTEITLDNGRVIPLSRRLYNEVNERFIEFYTKT